MLELDALAHEHIGTSVVAAVYDAARSKRDRFDQIELTHPAIFMVEFALAELLASYGVRPDYTLGTSLGAFAAAAVSGCLDVEAALLAVIEQARIVARTCERGGMVAIMGPPTLHAEPEIRDSEVAARNFASHFVVAATADRLPAIEERLRQRLVPHERLPVHYAFHSRWIESAGREYREHLSTLALKQPRIPMACCVSGGPLQVVANDYFWSVAREPIRFGEAVAHLEREGRYRYIDVGPSSTLATFLKYMLPASSASQAYSILTPFGRDLKGVEALQSMQRH
jgi:acyl transferase domain-containing protein